MDFSGDADAIAARFASGTLAPPAGETAVQVATGDAPQVLAGLPAVLVSLSAGELRAGNGSRQGALEYVARFYLAESADVATEGRRILAWASVLIDALKASAQLGGRVAQATVAGFTVPPGGLVYATKVYAGIELRVHVVTSEGWLASS